MHKYKILWYTKNIFNQNIPYIVQSVNTKYYGIPKKYLTIILFLVIMG